MDAEAGIRRTIARACQYLDDRRLRDYADLFTVEAVDGSANVTGHMSGREQVYERFSRGELARRPELRRRHLVTNVNIDRNEDSAFVVSDLVMFDLAADGSYTCRVGRYYDEFISVAGEWLLRERRLEWLDQLK
jgi:3-phenylpropionate/cinnamic acid dioxygenase small subunit